MKANVIQIAWHDIQPVLSIDYDEKSGKLVTGGQDTYVRIWALHAGAGESFADWVEYRATIAKHSRGVNSVRFRRDESGRLQVASGGDDGLLVISRWEEGRTVERSISDTSGDDSLEAWSVVRTYQVSDDLVDLTWSPCGRYLLSASSDHAARLWDTQAPARAPTAELHDHSKLVQGVAWDPKGEVLVSVGSDRCAWLYEARARPKRVACLKMRNEKSPPSESGQDSPASSTTGPATRTPLFRDEAAPTLFRRPAFDPSGEFLAVPAGAYAEMDAVWLYAKSAKWHAPVAALCTPSLATVVRWAPVPPRRSIGSRDPWASFRAVLAVGTLDGVVFFDTDSPCAVACVRDLHCAAVTDMVWTPDARYLFLSSRDGYCSFIYTHSLFSES